MILILLWGLGHSSYVLTTITNFVLGGLVEGKSQFSVEKVEGSLFSHLLIHELNLASEADSTHIRVDSIEVSYSLPQLLSLRFSEIRVSEIDYVLKRRIKGAFILPTFKPSSGNETSFSLEKVTIQHIKGVIEEGDSVLVAVEDAHLASRDIILQAGQASFQIDSLWADLDYPNMDTRGQFGMRASMDDSQHIRVDASALTQNSSFRIEAQASLDSLSLVGINGWLLNAKGELASSDVEPFIPGLSTEERFSFQAETTHRNDSTWVSGNLKTLFSGGVHFSALSHVRRDSLLHSAKIDLSALTIDTIYPGLASLHPLTASIEADAVGDQFSELKGLAVIHLNTGGFDQVKIRPSKITLRRLNSEVEGSLDLKTSAGNVSATGKLEDLGAFELKGFVQHLNLSKIQPDVINTDLNLRLNLSGEHSDWALNRSEVRTTWLSSSIGACSISGGTILGRYSPARAQVDLNLDACSELPLTSSITIVNPAADWRITSTTSVTGLRISDFLEQEERITASAFVSVNLGSNEKLSGSLALHSVNMPSAIVDSVDVIFAGTTDKLELEMSMAVGGGLIAATTTLRDFSLLTVHSGTLEGVDAFRISEINRMVQAAATDAAATDAANDLTNGAAIDAAIDSSPSETRASGTNWSNLNGTFSGIADFGTSEKAGELALQLHSSQFNRQLFDAQLTARWDSNDATLDVQSTSPDSSRLTASAQYDFISNEVSANIETDGFDLLPLLDLDGNSWLIGSISGNMVLSDELPFRTDLKLSTGSLFNGVALESVSTTLSGTVSSLNGTILKGTLEAALANGRVRSSFDMNDSAIEAQVFVENADIAALLGISSASMLSTSIHVTVAKTTSEWDDFYVRIDSMNAEYEHVSLASASGEIHYAADTFQIDSLQVLGTFGSFSAHGFLPRMPIQQSDGLLDGRSENELASIVGELNYDLKLNNEIGRISQIQKLNLGWFRAESAGRIEGAVGQTRLSASFSMTDVTGAGVTANRISGRLLGELRSNLSLAAAELVADAQLIEISPVIVERASVSLSYDGSEVDASLDAHFQENRDVGARISWLPFEAPNDFALLGFDASFDGDEWKMTGSPLFNSENATLSSPLVLHSGDQRIVAISSNVQGVVRNLITVQQLKIEPFADLMTYPELGGILGGTLTATSIDDRLELQGTLSGSVRAFDKSVGDINLQFSDDGVQTRLNAGLKDVNGESLQLSGSLPRFTSGDEIQIQLSAASYSIDWIRSLIDPDLIDDLKGRINGEIKISGTPQQPNWNGLVRLKNGAIGLPELGKRKGMLVTGIQSNFRFNGEVIEVDSLRAKSGDGWLRGSGTIDIKDLKLGEYNISLSANDFKAIDSPDYFAVVSGQMTLGGTTDRPKIGGRLTVQRGDFWLSDATTSDAFEPLALTDEDLNVLQRRFGLRIAPTDTTTFDAYHVLALENFTVRMERDTWIRSKSNPRMDVQLTGDLDVRKKPKQDPEVFGSITVLPDRSRIIQFGKRFELDRGELIFNGPMNAPDLNMEASYTVPSRTSDTEEVTIRLIASGRPDNLDVSFDSDPSMELADIVSYIATGRPAAASLQISGAQTDTYLQSAAGLAIGPLADLIENLAGAGLGLDVIEIEHTGFSGLTLTAGKYVSPKLYVSVSQPISLSSSSESSTGVNKNQTQVTIEYELVRQLLLSLLNRGTILRVNLRWQHAF